MSFVTVAPELITEAGASLQSIDDTVSAGLAFAAAPTTGVVPPAVDPVSTLTTALFAGYASAYQAVAAEAAAVQEQFVATIAASAESYSTAEAVNDALTSLDTELTRIAQTFITGTINAPPISYLSALIPYLLGINVTATGVASAPAPAAPALASSESPVAEPAVAAGLGSVTSRSVPVTLAKVTAVEQSWAAIGPQAAVNPVLSTSLGSGTTAAFSAEEGAAPIPGFPVSGQGGLHDEGDGEPRFAVRRTVMARSPIGG
ncbi:MULTISPECIES: PE family protein [Mycobacterium]|uniref:PE family protein n=1 Tax=Mycobacterium TaxID=1763 RepID=UPI0007C6E802|nr:MULTISPECIES: PE family protein [Mycobacterium]MDP7732154.1 PE family protein [Mycobacterium sp. TY813]